MSSTVRVSHSKNAPISANGLRTEVSALLQRSEAWMQAKNWSAGYFGKKAAGDDKVIGRMRGNLKVEVATLLRLEAFLDEAGFLSPETSGDETTSRNPDLRKTSNAG